MASSYSKICDMLQYIMLSVSLIFFSLPNWIFHRYINVYSILIIPGGNIDSWSSNRDYLSSIHEGLGEKYVLSMTISSIIFLLFLAALVVQFATNYKLNYRMITERQTILYVFVLILSYLFVYFIFFYKIDDYRNYYETNVDKIIESDPYIILSVNSLSCLFVCFAFLAASSVKLIKNRGRIRNG